MRLVDRRLLERARPARRALMADAALGVVAALLILTQAVLLARVVARVFDGASLGDVRLELALLAGAIALRAVIVWAFEATGRVAAVAVLSDLRLSLVRSRLRDRPAAEDGVQSAEVATVGVQGVDALETYFARYLPQVVLAAVVPLTVVAFVLTIDPLSAGLMLVTLPLVPIFMVLIGRYTERRTRRRWRALETLSSHFLDVARGLPTLRAFNRSEAQAGRIAAVNDDYRRETMGTLRVAFLSGAVLELAATLGVALVAVTVGVRLVEGHIGFQTALTVLVLVPELYLPLRNLAVQYHASADGLAVSRRLLDLTAAPTPRPREARPPSPASAPVRFEGVSFVYPSRPVDVLRSVDLELSPGLTTALVGPSGGGKSTIAALLLGFAEPTSGRITIGGEDLAGVDLEAWRRLTAWVPQNPTVFRGTIAANIALGNPRADEKAIERAAAKAGADEFIDALPAGLATKVGDGGRELSAGQRQRLALARAFLRDAPLVVLDEPTANLDRSSAGIVARAVDELAGRTVLLIAHRPELAERADRLLHLDGGRVEERRMGVAA